MVMSRALAALYRMVLEELKPGPPLAEVNLVVIVCLVMMIVGYLVNFVNGCVEVLYYYLVVVVQPIPFSLDFSRIVATC